MTSYKGTKSGAETSPSSDNQKTSKAASKNAVTESTDAVDENVDAVTESADAITLKSEKSTLSTQRKRKQNKTKKNKTNNLPNPPQGGDEGGGVERNNLIKKGKITPDEISDQCTQWVIRNMNAFMNALFFENQFNLNNSRIFTVLLSLRHKQNSIY